MTKCGKGCMPECEYFTTGGCISPFNCPYKIETGYINSVTSIPTYMEQYNGMSDDNIKCLKPENAELCHRADVAEKALRRKRESEADSTCPCDENSDKCKVCVEKRLCSTEYATQCYYEKAIHQAEREIERG